MRHAVVLAGGSGKRLWPMSTRDEPKQLVPLPDGRTLLETAVARVAPLVDPRFLRVCALERHRDRVMQVLPDLGAESYVGEPVGRDTYPAIGLSAAVAAAQDPEAILGVFTADHAIQPVETFRQIVDRAFGIAETAPDAIVTFGIVPTYAATIYGYLELGEPDLQGAVRVRRFREKPDALAAATMHRAGPGRYLWNSGMFIFRAATVLECIRRYDPGLREGLERVARGWGTASGPGDLETLYRDLRPVSFDYAVMERASTDAAVRVLALPMPLSWVDVGSWPAYATVLTPDARGNAELGTTTVLDTRDTVVVSHDPEHLVAVLGCQDLVVVHTRNATLIASRQRVEDLKELHSRVAEQHGERWL